MLQSKTWMRAVSEFTLVAFATSVFTPSQAFAGFYRPEVQDAVVHYTVASQHREGGGLEAFLDAYRDDLASTDLEFIVQSLSIMKLPEVTVDNAEFTVGGAEGSQSARVKVVDLDQREFRINGLNFVWDESQSFESNVKRLLPLTKAEGFTLQNIWHVLVPTAYAEEGANPAEMGIPEPGANSPSPPQDATLASEPSSEPVASTTSEGAEAGHSSEEKPAEKKGWSTTTKVLVGVAIAVVVGLIIWYLISKNNEKKKEEEEKRKAKEKEKEQKAALKAEYDDIKGKVRQASDDNFKKCGADWVHLNEVYSDSDSTQQRVDKLNAAYAEQQNACPEGSGGAVAH